MNSDYYNEIIYSSYLIDGSIKNYSRKEAKDICQRIYEGNLDFTDTEAEVAVLSCVDPYACGSESTVTVPRRGGDWSGEIRNMLISLRNKAKDNFG